MFPICFTYVWHMFHICLTYVLHMFHIYFTYVPYMFHICSTYVPYMFHICCHSRCLCNVWCRSTYVCSKSHLGTLREYSFWILIRYGHGGTWQNDYMSIKGWCWCWFQHHHQFRVEGICILCPFGSPLGSCEYPHKIVSQWVSEQHPPPVGWGMRSQGQSFKCCRNCLAHLIGDRLIPERTAPLRSWSWDLTNVTH